MKLLIKARKYGINISKAASDGIQAAIEREEKLKALTENKSEDNLTYQ
jgi:post-segregation antitoxin (ccd killing protein)